MDVKNIYKQLTNVNIVEQKQLWDERGKGYYGEFSVFCELYKNVTGCCKILMNLNIPTEKGKTTEIDLLMIHETGIYVFEIKHYKGTIYGDDTGNIWTQYFRTTKNSTFKNPMLQNDYHIKAIKNLYPNIPLSSIIVFTNEECNLKVTNNNPNISLCEIYNLHKILEHRFSLRNTRYSMEEIDSIFDNLSKYSQMQEKVLIDGIEKSFISWLQPSLVMLDEKKSELDIEKNNYIINSSNLKKAKKTGIMFNVIIAIACILFSVFQISSIKNNYDTELAKFKQNFLHVDEIDNEYIDVLNDYVDVSNVSLTELSGNSVSFTARLAMTNDIYGIELNEDSKYIVMTYDSKVYEYDVFGEHLKYYPYSNKVGNGIREYGELAKAQFFGINKNDISYIKITNITLFKIDTLRTTVKDELELELYKN